MVAPDNDDPDNPSTLSTHRYKFDHKLNLRNKGKGFAAFSLTFGPYARSCGFGSALTQAAPTMVDVMKTHPDFSRNKCIKALPKYMARHEKKGAALFNILIGALDFTDADQAATDISLRFARHTPFASSEGRTVRRAGRSCGSRARGWCRSAGRTACWGSRS